MVRIGQKSFETLFYFNVSIYLKNRFFWRSRRALNSS